jgi:diguanylate cyclase (GGDEF)-like protein
VSYVLEDDRPGSMDTHTLFAVFRETVDNGEFYGLATVRDIMLHPDWIFADLVEHRDLLAVDHDVDVYEALKRFDQQNVDALPVLADQRFIGVVTRQSILEKLLQQERFLLTKSRHLTEMLQAEREQMQFQTQRLSDLHDASRRLLSVLARTSVQNDLLHTGIEALAHLLEARYGAIGILDERGQLQNFVYTGISAQQAQAIGQLPEGKGLLGVVIQENVSLRLEDMSRDPRSIGFPPNHPSMKSLLAVPISHQDRIYGRIYLSDKVNAQPFTESDEELAMSFAHSLALVLENAKKIEEVQRAQQNLDHLAHFDSLTDLPNRTLLRDRMQQAITHAQRTGGSIGLLFLDLDNFKVINDTLGHSQGDMLLKSVARQISGSVRMSDTVARLGGDEFIVMLPDIFDPQDAANVAEKILSSLSGPLALDKQEIFVSSSIGISIYPSNSKNIEGLLANADNAMYHAKKQGKNNFQFFSPEMNNSAHAHMKLEKHLRRALEQGEFMLYYQPQVDITTGLIVGMEALIRWASPELGTVAPGDFIALAEEIGLIVPIGAWVLKTACNQAQLWQQNGIPTRVAVNLSSRQFLQSPKHIHSRHPLLETVLTALEDTGLPPELLELEITEGILMHRLDTTMDILNTLKSKGVRLSIDDFGTGYSSLSYLKRFPIHTLKIDKSFVNDISTDPSDKAIVAAITAMAQKLKLEVVAEGVETLAQLEFLRELGCSCVQGHYFSKPLPADESWLLLQKGIEFSDRAR